MFCQEEGKRNVDRVETGKVCRTDLSFQASSTRLAGVTDLISAGGCYQYYITMFACFHLKGNLQSQDR